MTVLARWRALEPSRRILLLRAVGALCSASIKVRLMPFARIAAGIGSMRPPPPPPLPDAAGEAAKPADQARARHIRWAVDAAARRLPFECACLARALAAHALAREQGLAPVLHMGAQAGQQGCVETHAWLTAAGVGVTGYPLPPGMVEIGRFPS
jgi:hypothetical protein